MAKTKTQKQNTINELESALKKMKSAVIVDYYGLSVKNINVLRKAARSAENCQYIVTKKSLMNIALKKMGFEDIDIKKLSGGLGIVFGFSDEITPAKIVATFAKTNEKIKITGGLLEGKLIDETMIKYLSKIPSKQELLTQLVWTLKAPISALVYGLNSLKSKKEALA
ncbi:MAG: 50S ribosomal protein L10 [Patescibacteria group bacterium]